MNPLFPKTSSIKGWLKNAKNSFLILLHLIKFRCPPPLIRYQVVAFLAHTLVYPVVRLISLGKIKAANICLSFLNVRSSIIFPLPLPLKSKIAMSQIDTALYDGIYLQDEYRQELLKKGMNVVDIGANIGVYTVLAAEKVGENGKVVAIEPEPKNYKQLLENIKLNNFQNVIPKNIALTDHEGLEKLYLSSSFAGHSLVFHEDEDSYINIPVTTIDKLVDELNIKRIDIIKIDTEGAEMPILKGAEKTLKSNPNVKIFVASYHYPSQVKEVRQFLSDRGFKTKVSSRDVVMTI